MSELVEKIKTLPFLRMIIPVVAGILIASNFEIASWALWSGLAIVYVFAFYSLGRSKEGWIYIFSALMLTAIVVTKAHSTAPVLPEGEKILMQLQITDNPSPRSRWNVTTARVGFYRHEGDSVWNAVDQKLLLSVDTCYNISMGDQLICRAYVNSLEKITPDSMSVSGYAKLMNTRGFWGRSYITPGGLIVKTPGQKSSISAFAKGMQRQAVRRLSLLDLSADGLSVASTMAAGERRSLSPTLRESYSRTGTSHLLAVSGLHVGIVFALINCILYLLPLFNRGHIARNVIAIAAIWVFAAMTGLSASVVRAAMMFTGGQIALASSSYRSMINILFATATIMLLINPNYLFDVSFQLSMIAVLSIMVMYKPLFNRLKTKNKILNLITGIFIVGISSTIGTAPLVAYYFHMFSPAGILINLPVIFTAHIIVFLSVLWITLPWGLMNGITSFLLDGAIGIQNGLVVWGAKFPLAIIDVNIGLATTIAIYAFYLLIYIAFAVRDKKTEPDFESL